MSRTSLLVLACLVAAAPAAFAQPSLSVEFGRAFDNLSFAEAGQDGQGVTAISTDAEYLALDERLRFWYSLDASTYSTPGAWGTLLHAGGTTWQKAFGPQAAHALYVGGTLAARHNGESWDAADFRAAGAFANIELKPSAALVFRSGYQIDRRLFADYAELDQTQQQIFGSALVNLPSRTTLVGEVHGGWKTYDGTPASEVTVHSSTGGSSPSGIGSAGSGGPGSGISGGMGGRPAIAPSSSTVVLAGVPKTTASMITVYGRVAQNLAERTGVAADLAVRNTFGDLPPAVINTPARFFDDGVYDDPFASDATTASATLTHLWPSFAELRITGAWSDRRYTSTPAYGLDGQPLPDGTLRADDIWRGAVKLTLPVFASQTGPWDVALVLGYDYTHHRSTDAFYRYTSHAFGFGASLSY